MEIYTALKADHKIVKQLLKQLDKTDESDGDARTELLAKLKEALVPHARAEEAVLYERLKRAEVKEADALAFEGYEEHAVVDRLMAELESTAPNDKRWTALLSVVKESLEHHIEEEEEEMFAKAHKAFDRATATAMTAEFEKLKARFLAEVKAGKTPAQKTSHERVKAA